VDWRYSKFDPSLRDLKELLKKLLSIFNQLLLHTDGDVEQALSYLDQIGRRYGFFNEKFTIEDFKKFLEKDNAIARDGSGRLALTKKGEQRIRTSSLESIFSSLERDAQGEHRVATAGVGMERLPETRPYAFGDPLSLLDPNETLSNAIKRGGIDSISIDEEDLRVYETEHLSSCATVLMIDVSHSMVLYGEDRITPAKRVALALCELITTRYPKDSLSVILFGDEAWEVSMADIPYLSAGPYHTNTKAGLELAREILRKKRQANRQIFMLTDGKPSALTERNGEIYKNPFGLDRRIVNKTLEEADNCRRIGIPITTFMLTTDPTLVEFVDRFTKANRGRAYYSELERLGSFVLVDYMKNKRRRVR
jgi:Ca-activated chloride channel family protein